MRNQNWIAIIGLALGVYNFCAAIIKGYKEKKLRAGMNLVKAEYRRSEISPGHLARYLYVINSDIRPVSNLKVEFCNNEGGIVRELPILTSLAFSSEFCVDFFTNSLGGDKKRNITKARIIYTDYDGKIHDYVQDDIHCDRSKNP